MNTFVLATHNQHKIEEFNAILGELVPGITVIGYEGPEPIEDGVSFAENSLIKARAAAAHTGLPSLSDDSGICVDVLGGMPGIFSARWAGAQKDNAANVQLLLDQMSDVRDGDRGAHFTCHIAVVNPETDEEIVVVGNWPGTVARKVHGTNGFGYDPVFIPEGFDVTAATLNPTEKNKISHRSRALQALAERLNS